MTTNETIHTAIIAAAVDIMVNETTVDYQQISAEYALVLYSHDESCTDNERRYIKSLDSIDHSYLIADIRREFDVVANKQPASVASEVTLPALGCSCGECADCMAPAPVETIEQIAQSFETTYGVFVSHTCPHTRYDRCSCIWTFCCKICQTTLEVSGNDLPIFVATGGRCDSCVGSPPVDHSPIAPNTPGWVSQDEPIAIPPQFETPQQIAERIAPWIDTLIETNRSDHPLAIRVYPLNGQWTVCAAPTGTDFALALRAASLTAQARGLNCYKILLNDSLRIIPCGPFSEAEALAWITEEQNGVQGQAPVEPVKINARIAQHLIQAIQHDKNELIYDDPHALRRIANLKLADETGGYLRVNQDGLAAALAWYARLYRTSPEILERVRKELTDAYHAAEQSDPIGAIGRDEDDVFARTAATFAIEHPEFADLESLPTFDQALDDFADHICPRATDLCLCRFVFACGQCGKRVEVDGESLVLMTEATGRKCSACMRDYLLIDTTESLAQTERLAALEVENDQGWL